MEMVHAGFAKHYSVTHDGAGQCLGIGFVA